MYKKNFFFLEHNSYWGVGLWYKNDFLRITKFSVVSCVYFNMLLLAVIITFFSNGFVIYLSVFIFIVECLCRR